jgi:hypothetical protein
MIGAKDKTKKITIDGMNLVFLEGIPEDNFFDREVSKALNVIVKNI